MITTTDPEQICREALARILEHEPTLLRVETFDEPKELKGGDLQHGTVLLVCDVAGIKSNIETFNFFVNQWFLRLPEEIVKHYRFDWKCVAEGRKVGLIP